MASHLLYTQVGVLSDSDAKQRRMGMEAGLAWGSVAEATVVYTDLGITDGMLEGIRRAGLEGREIEYRLLPEWNGAGTAEAVPVAEDQPAR